MRPNRIATLNFFRVKPDIDEFSSTIPITRHECELQRALERRRAVDSTVNQMTEFLTKFLHGKASRETLKDFARKLAQTKGIRVDRAATRTKEGLICWFCESAPELLTGTATNEFSKPDDTLDGLFVEFDDEKFDEGEDWLHQEFKF
jgi:hypothetical protein